nr:seminal metalloprotease 1-like [Maniola hyperantus]
MKWLVIILTLAHVMANLPSPTEIGTKVAVSAVKQYLKSKFNGQDSVVGDLMSLRGALPPDVNLEEHSGFFQGDIVLDDAYIDGLVNSMLRNAYIGYDSRWPNNTVPYEFNHKDFGKLRPQTMVGDIVLDDAYIDGLVNSMLRNAYIGYDSRWPNNTVPYEFNHKDFDEEQQDAIREGMNLISNKTCVKFRPRLPKDKVYVNITGNATGCYAHVGYYPGLIKGTRVLNYAPHPPGQGCLKNGTIVHEQLHTLGFQHMHSTYDRDKWIRVIEENIMPEALSFFAIFTSDQVSNLGVPYDIQSVLHYSPLAFSRNGSYTIEALKPYEGLMGQRDYVTESDWLRVNRHYDCPGAWDEPDKKICDLC